MQRLLSPVVVVLIQRPNDHLSTVLQSVRGTEAKVTALGLPMSAREEASLKQMWQDVDDIPIIILHREPESAVCEAVEAVALIHQKHPNLPLVVVYANHDQDPQLIERRELIALKLQGSILDIQQLEYSPTWRKSPPRFR